MILATVGAGVVAGAIILFLAHIAPFIGAKRVVRDLDRPRVFGTEVTRREAHLIGVLVHVILSGVFGGLFGYAVQFGIFTSIDLISILIWSMVLVVFTGGVLLPLEGHGIFGFKEDRWFPIDLIISNALWGMLFWLILRLWVVAN